MRPQTLAEAVERIQSGVSSDVALAEFVDTFDLAPTIEAKYLTIEHEPPLTQALAGAIVEYLAKNRKLGRVPRWVGGDARYLDQPWHTCRFEDAGMREYLTFAGPGEFASRNIFTEKRPLRRARGPRPPEDQT